MRKNLVVSNETKSVMNQVIGTLKATGLSGVEISTLVGILLYIKKQKAQLVDSFEYNQPLFELLDSDDDLYGEAEGVFIRTISKINIKFINQTMKNILIGWISASNRLSQINMQRNSIRQDTSVHL